MILTPIRRYGAMILVLPTLMFSSEVLARTYTTTVSQKSHLIKASNKQVSSKQEYFRSSTKGSSLPDLRKYPSGTPGKKAFPQTVMPHITSQNAAITTERNWLILKQYQGQWSLTERTRLKDIAEHCKVKWFGNTRKISWSTLLGHTDIIPISMVATMATAESGWGMSKLAHNSNNLLGTKRAKGRRINTPDKAKRYSQFSSVKESVSVCVTDLNTRSAYFSLRKSRVQPRKADQEVTAIAMAHKLKGYSTKGKSYNNYLFTTYQDNQRLITAHM